MLGYGRDTTPFLDTLRRSGHLHVVRTFYSALCCTFGVVTLLRGFALQDVLKRVGYRVHFLLSGDHTNFAGLKSYYGPHLDFYSDGLDQARRYTLNDDRGLFESFDQLAFYDGTPGDIYGVVDHTPGRTLKYIYDARTKAEELYDDTGDPAERRNILATAGKRELGELRAAVGAFSVHPGT